jgi:hypothetical protein
MQEAVVVVFKTRLTSVEQAAPAVVVADTAVRVRLYLELQTRVAVLVAANTHMEAPHK